MEILEAFKVIEPVGTTARIFEFRGRFVRYIDTTTESGEAKKVLRKGKPRSIHVAAENLYDAVLHLREYRPDFFPHQAFSRGDLRIRR
jgi:hypothetical protein